MLEIRPRWLIALILLSTSLYIAFCIYFVFLEDPVYVWDFGEFWRMYQRLGAGLGSPGWLESVIMSVYNMDYNISGALLLMPTHLMFGEGRGPYVATIAVLYGVPACALAAFIAITVCSLKSKLSQAATFILALSNLPLLAPTLRGMWDTVGLIPLGLAAILILRSSYLTKARLAQVVVVGASLWATFLLRRWYAYSVVGLMTVTFVFAITSSHRELRNSKAALALLGKFSLVTAVFCFLALVAQGGLISRILFTNYGELYAAYHRSFSENLQMAFQRTGIVNCLVIAIGFISAISYRASGVVFCGTVAALVYFLFTRTQLMGVHHFLPVAFFMFPVLVFGVKSASTVVRLRDQWAFVAYTVFSVFILLGSTVFPRWLPASIYPSENRPLTLDNRIGYEQLIQAIRQSRSGPDQINTFGSSLILNDSLLRSLSPDLSNYVLITPHLASVQPFRFESLRAKYQVATIPAMTHLAPGTQRHLEVPNNLLIAGSGFGSGFARIGGPYQLSDGVSAFLYKRNRSLVADDVIKLIPVLLGVNPSWHDDFFNGMELRLALRDEELGDKWGNVVSLGNSVLIHPGEKTPTSVIVPLKFLDSKLPKSVSFSMPVEALKSCPMADGVTVFVSLDGQADWSSKILPGETRNASIVPGEKLKISVQNNDNPYCDSVTAAFSM
ncbi:hypothetical protein [Agrobacterium pusense]|uniref:hypothetical protein n=1 Tax=Agrobacterium pusense TaxID=648995 RepID=UPI0028A9FE50|nr:hypothetical protein [Agrobacterium pusense]